MDPDRVPRDSVSDPERVRLLGVCVDLVYVYVKAHVADGLNVCVAVMLGTSETVGVGVAKDWEPVGDGEGERLVDSVWLGVHVCDCVQVAVALRDMEAGLGVSVGVETRDKEREPVGEPWVPVPVIVGEPDSLMLRVAVSVRLREPGDFVDVLLFEALGVGEPVAVAVDVRVGVRAWVDVHVMLPVRLGPVGLCTQDMVDSEKLRVRVTLSLTDSV